MDATKPYECIWFWAMALSQPFLDSAQETKQYILVFLVSLQVFGQSWAQEPAQRPRLEKRYTNQRTLT
jgi:hypothetical protein